MLRSLILVALHNHVLSKKFFSTPHSRKAVSGEISLALVRSLVSARRGANEFIHYFFAKVCCGGPA
jgi:hypothetical protein